MSKRTISARILRVQGFLILVVAAIHFAVTPLLRATLVHELSAADFQFVWPPFLLSFVVMGILLVPVGVSTLFCASGVMAGQRWSWRFGITARSFEPAVCARSRDGQELLHRHPVPRRLHPDFTGRPVDVLAALVGAERTERRFRPLELRTTEGPRRLRKSWLCGDPVALLCGKSRQ
jgi:hypothetical protein